jgi:glycosyltransferase involved in cell wall biosynthesis
MPRVLLDVSQWAHWPAATGIQRVLGHLAERWHGDEVEASFGLLENDAYVVGPIAGLASVLRSRFERRNLEDDRAPTGTSVVHDLRTIGQDVVPTDRLAGTFAGYFLPEPTLRSDSLSVFTRLSRTSSVVPFALHFDALPLTHPQFFPPKADQSGAVTRYHRAVAQIENVAFISENSRRVFEARLARRRLRNALVVRPGADALSARRYGPPETPRFCMVGTVEPRKRYAVVLDVFERLWATGRPYELVVLGKAAWETQVVFERLERLSRSRPLQWVDEADDEDIVEAMSRSTALLFLSEAEGFGLPPMEALSVGCPVIISQDLPALEGMLANGQVRLKRMSPQLVYAAVETLADPILNAQHRAAIQALELPTWERFASTIENWVARRLREERTPLVA